MVDTLGLPTIFFTHSSADTQWPELARLICHDNPYSSACRNSAFFDNPAIADWFFHHRITKYIDTFYVGVLGATDYWVRFEWQHRGSPHVHGVAWLPDAPNVKDLTSEHEATVAAAKESIIQYVDRLVSTVNPAIAADGSDADQAPLPKTKPQHICNKAYAEVKDYDQDLKDLIATCQRHTRCSAAYCLKTGRGGKQECRFGYPEPLQAETTITMVEGDPVLVTKRNDPLVNDHNTTQLSTWRGNVDMKVCVSRRKVIDYVAKYATKSEPRSKALREVYSNIVKKGDDCNITKVAQKIMISSVAERDYSAQETGHLLLQLPMYTASWDFVPLSLDGSREVLEKLNGDQPATSPCLLDYYMERPTTSQFQELPLLQFARKYKMPKAVGTAPVQTQGGCGNSSPLLLTGCWRSQVRAVLQTKFDAACAISTP